MTGKYTLVFDGNFFLHRIYFVGQKIKTGKPFNFIDELDADKNLLLWKLSIDFASEIKRFEGVINRVVYTVDSSSWRKKYLDSQYKANRVKSESINWNEIYNVHTEFVNALEKQGVTVSRIQQAEADDLIFAWTSFLNQQGQNCIIISGDNDLLQLVNHDTSSSANTIYYNKFDKDLHVFPKFQSWLDIEEHATTNDIFNLPVDLITNTKQNLRDVIKTNKMKSHEVNVMEFLFRKILIGDAGDNVPPLHTKVKETKRGPITYRVTDNHANEILSRFKDDKPFINQSHLFTEEHINRICSIAKDVIKIELPVEQVEERWKINRDLVYLHINCIPKEVTDSMFSSIELKYKKVLSTTDINSISNKDKILEKTTYTKEKKTEFNESGLFRPISESKSDVKIIESTDSGFDQGFWDNLLK